MNDKIKELEQRVKDLEELNSALLFELERAGDLFENISIRLKCTSLPPEIFNTAIPFEEVGRHLKHCGSLRKGRVV